MIRAIASSLIGGGTFPVLLLVAAIGLFATGYWKGGTVARGECEAAQLRKDIDTLEADRDRLQSQLNAARRAQDDLAAQIMADDQADETTKEKSNALNTEVGSRDDGCSISDDDASRLRSIR